MPSAKCKGCGHSTNSTTSNYWFVKPIGEPTECYARFVDGKWEKGCAYDKADSMTKSLVDGIIKEK